MEYVPRILLRNVGRLWGGERGTWSWSTMLNVVHGTWWWWWWAVIGWLMELEQNLVYMTTNTNVIWISNEMHHVTGLLNLEIIMNFTWIWTERGEGNLLGGVGLGINRDTLYDWTRSTVYKIIIKVREHTWNECSIITLILLRLSNE